VARVERFCVCLGLVWVFAVFGVVGDRVGVGFVCFVVSVG